MWKPEIPYTRPVNLARQDGPNTASSRNMDGYAPENKLDWFVKFPQTVQPRRSGIFRWLLSVGDIRHQNLGLYPLVQPCAMSTKPLTGNWRVSRRRARDPVLARQGCLAAVPSEPTLAMHIRRSSRALLTSTCRYRFKSWVHCLSVTFVTM